jgi:hypothetical protein
MFRLRTILSLLLAIAAVACFSVYRAARSVPDFYEAAVAEIPPEAGDKAGDEFTATTVSLAGQARREGQWDAFFTDEQVNGWLAVDLPTKHPELLPTGYEQPRIRFAENGLQLGVRYKAPALTTVVWLDVDVQMTGTHEAALRFRRVRAGLLPLPLKQILDALTQVATDLELPLRWTNTDGDPTAVVGLPTLDNNGLQYDLESLQLSDGRLYVSGRTSRVATARRTSSAAR